MQKTFEPHRLTQFTTAGSTSRRKVDMRALITSISVRALDPKTAVNEAVVQVSGYFYTVDLGPDVLPRSHHVGKDKRCSCLLGPDCPAVPAVVAYLRKGGQRAPDPPHGFYPLAPERCPVCGALAFFEPKLSSKRRGAGWGCSKAGEKHYWRDRCRIIQEAFAANPWRFPPVVIRAGEQINAWDGIQPGDSVLYPGLLRADIISS